MSRGRNLWGLAFATALIAASAGSAGIVVYEEGNKKIEVGGRIQLQYLNINPESGDSRDDVFFRRLRPYIAGTVTEDWYGKIQFDFGKSLDSDEVAIKDAFMRYSGFKAEGLKLSIGNTKTPFSREFLTSSKRQQHVERTFTGDHNFGSPDRQLGLRLDGKASSGKFSYSAAVGAEHHDPASGRMDFDSPVNRQGDWNEGWVAAGRVDFHPLGYMKFDQGDFRSDDWKFTVGASGFTWSNDDDNNTFTDDDGLSLDPDKADLDSATGFEVSSGLRGHGLSVDAAFQVVSGDTVVEDFTGGIYLDGTTDLEKITVEGGYMVLKNLELALGFESQDADNYQTEFERVDVSVNWFWNKHKAKLQLTHRMATNVAGEEDVDIDTTFLQAQYVF
ncbi:MAG: hypothetical protein GY716_00920 [bacterium]|nr:hypothetical protein [bacterium]